MKLWLVVTLAVGGLVGCGFGLDAPRCSCTASTSQGARPLACGTSACIGSDSFACSPGGQLAISLNACGGPSMTGPTNTCTRRTCDGACGAVPDGCGGTLQCAGCNAGERCGASNRCEPLCTGVTCATGQRCEPSTGQCLADACSRAGAVCGVVDGQTCGVCPGGSVCSASKTACIETVATVPARYVDSTALVGTTLYVTGFDSTSAQGRDLYAVDLTTKQVQRVASGTVLSPVRASGQTVLWAELNGLRRLPAGSTTPTTITGTTGQCTDLVEAGGFIYCSIGGDPRFGVSSFGIRRIPSAGGPFTWTKQFLNRARLAFVAPFVFYIGTTDNSSSFANLGAVDTSDGMDQVVVSGGALQSNFVLASQQGFFFVESGAQSKLTQVPFDSPMERVLLTGDWFDRASTVLQGGDVFTVTKVGPTLGLWRVPLANVGARSLTLTAADLQATDQERPEAVYPQGSGWLFVTNSVVYRTVGAGQ
ncbi:MAG: hypothetical protein SFW67_37230 [Myxococcaceae bacterium]|nr:hypothetical protein [Myxococcaceae bacterium]